MTEMIIREATLKDARGIGDVQLASWRWAYRGVMPDEFLDEQTVEIREAYWQEALPEIKHDRKIWVAEREGRVIAFALAGPARYQGRGGSGELQTLYAHPDSARGGVGKALFQIAHDWLKAEGHDGFYVMCMKCNPIGRSFYQKMGGTEHPDPFITNFNGTEIDDTAQFWRFD